MKEMNNCSYAYAVGKLEERWRTLLEEEIDNCVPMTFMVCTAVAGMVSEFRGEESVKVILSEIDSDRTEESLVANATLLFARTGGCISCRKFKINSKETSDGGTYLMYSIPVMQELQTERGYYTHHKTIIVVYKEWIDIATRESYEFQGIEPEPKMEGPLPTVWLEIKPGVSWFKYKESALMAVRAYRDVSGYKSREAYNQLIRWGDERMIDILDSEIESFKRHAEERGLYKDAPEEFYRQIGLILVALKIVRKVYGIHTKKKELESFIFENVTVAWHTKVVDQCYEYPYEDSEEGDLF